MLHLEMLHRQGVPLFRLRLVNWETDPITLYWMNGSKSSPDEFTGKWPEVPSPDNGVAAGDEASRLARSMAFESSEPKKRRRQFVGRGGLS